MTTRSKSKSNKPAAKKSSKKNSKAADFGRKTVRDEIVLSVKDLKTQFTTKYGTVKAVDGVSFDLKKGETLGIVGESGSGKSVTSLSLMRLVPQPPGEIVSGEVNLNGKNLLALSEKEMTEVRGGEISLILQDPMTALNPCFSIENQVGEGIRIHQGDKGKNLFEKVVDALKSVRIPAADQRAKDYPHQLSGGERRKCECARLLGTNPSYVLFDEPFSALDPISINDIKSEIYRLKEKGISVIITDHQVREVLDISDYSYLLFSGEIIAHGTSEKILGSKEARKFYLGDTFKF